MRPGTVVSLAALMALACVPLRAATLPPASPRRIDFQRDVYPILARRCFGCHQGSAATSGHRLDRRDVLLGQTNGRALVVAGKSAESPLIHRVAGLVPDRLMPPPGSGERLSGEQVAILRAWIDQGVVWDETLLPSQDDAKTHWAFRPIRRPAVPHVGVNPSPYPPSPLRGPPRPRTSGGRGYPGGLGGRG